MTSSCTGCSKNYNGRTISFQRHCLLFENVSGQNECIEEIAAWTIDIGFGSDKSGRFLRI